MEADAGPLLTALSPRPQHPRSLENHGPPFPAPAAAGRAQVPRLPRHAVHSGRITHAQWRQASWPV